MKSPGLAAAALVILRCCASAQTPPRAVVADLVNSSRDRHSALIRAASDSVAAEITRTAAYEVVARQAVERAAKARRLEPPYLETDLAAIAMELGAPLLITGEIRHAEIRSRSGRREAEVGLIIRVRSLALDELVNGAAERGIAQEDAGAKSPRPDVILTLDAAANAAARIAARIAANRPIQGTVMNTAGNGLVVMNRGAGHGVKGKQEFVVFRNGLRVGRLRVYKIFPMYSEMSVIENAGGIRPEDRAVAVFPEPRFGK